MDQVRTLRKLVMGLPIVFAYPSSAQESAVNSTETGAEVTASDRCVSPTQIVPPFNNSAEALEQSRIAATEVEAIRRVRGESRHTVCRTSAMIPELSDLEGMDEVSAEQENDLAGAEQTGAEAIADD